MKISILSYFDAYCQQIILCKQLSQNKIITANFRARLATKSNRTAKENMYKIKCRCKCESKCSKAVAIRRRYRAIWRLLIV
jgi:hypothetical protein